MTTPNTPHRFIAGAIDLGEVKAKAEARAQAAQEGAGNPGGTRTGVAAALTLTMENVEDELLKRSAQVPVIVLIGTPRSEDSNRLRADFTDLAEAGHYSFVFRYADADATPDIARMFGVQGLPTVVAIAAGQPIANFAGGQPKEALTQWVAAVKDAVAGQLTGIPAEELAGAADNEAAEPEDPRFIPAEKAMAEGDYAAAISVYEGILAQDPKNAAARAARDNARLLGRLTDAGDTDPIAEANAHPTDVAAGFAAADAEAAAGDAEAAFDRLLALMAAAPDRKPEIRDRLLELFALFDPTDPRVLAARGKLASALF